MQRPVLQSREVLNGYVYFASDSEGKLAGVRFNRGDTDSQHTITFVRKHGDWEAVSAPIPVRPTLNNTDDAEHSTVANHNAVFHDGSSFVAALVYDDSLHIWHSVDGAQWTEQLQPVMPAGILRAPTACYGLSDGVLLCVVQETTNNGEYDYETGRSFLLESADGGLTFVRTGISLPDAYLKDILVARGNGVIVVQLPLNALCSTLDIESLRVSRRRYLLVKKDGAWIKHVANADAPAFPDWFFADATYADYKAARATAPYRGGAWDFNKSPFFSLKEDLSQDPVWVPIDAETGYWEYPTVAIAADWKSSVTYDNEGFDPPIPIITKSARGWRAKRAFDMLHDVWFSRHRSKFICGNRSSYDALTWTDDAPVNDDVYLTMPINQGVRAGGHDTDRWHLSIRYPYADIGPFVPLEHFNGEWPGGRYSGDRVFIDPFTGSPGLAMLYGLKIASKDPQLPLWARPVMKSADGSSSLTYIEQERLANYIDGFGPHKPYYASNYGDHASYPGTQNTLVSGERAWFVTRFTRWVAETEEFVDETVIHHFQLPPPDQFWEKKVFAYE